MSAYEKSLQQIVVETADRIQFDLVNTGDVSSETLAVLNLIQADSKFIRKIETELGLPLTGDLDRLIEDYRAIYYTRKYCFEYHHNPVVCLWQASKYDHYDVAQKAIEKIVKDYNTKMTYAVENRDMNFIKLMSEKNVKDYNQAMATAAENGHIDIVQLMLEAGAKNYGLAMEAAASNGHTDIVKLMLKLGAKNYGLAIYHAATNGHTDIVKLMLGAGAKDYDLPMSNAAENGHTDIVKLMLEAGAKKYDWAIRHAAENGHMDIVELIENWKLTH